MSEDIKKQEFLNYLESNVWSEAERVGLLNHDTSLIKGIRLTRIRISNLPTVTQMVHFFWSAIYGTEKSINFSDKMKQYNLTRFEDILEDVRVKFNDNWLRA